MRITVASKSVLAWVSPSLKKCNNMVVTVAGWRWASQFIPGTRNIHVQMVVSMRWFQISLHEKWLFHQTTILKWMFRVTRYLLFTPHQFWGSTPCRATTKHVSQVIQSKWRDLIHKRWFGHLTMKKGSRELTIPKNRQDQVPYLASSYVSVDGSPFIDFRWTQFSMM